MSIGLNINKANWLPVKFGDVVNEIKETTAHPEADGLHRIVGLEHIEPENIDLTAWGELSESITFSRIFRKGQMLFGKRRPYLKKAALASFDGICSGDIIVMESRPALLPELLPFVVCNDKFFEHAVKTSAGSLSPRTKFKSLAEYEFLLPPVEQQKSFAELLWAGNDVVDKQNKLLRDQKKILEIFLSDLRKPKPNWTTVPLKQIINLNYGKPLKEENRLGGAYPVVSSAGIFGSHNKFLVEGPGIVVGRKGSAGQITWVNDSFWPTDTAFWVLLNEVSHQLPLKFIFYLLVAANLKSQTISTAVPGLNRDDALSMKIFIPSNDEINNFLNKLSLIESAIAQTELAIKSSKELQKSLLNQIF